MSDKDFSGRVLIRIPPLLHQAATECASNLGTSLNNFVYQAIKERVDLEMSIKNINRVVIGDLKVKEIREAVIVTQHPWFMQIFNSHNIYFFNPNLGAITPMQYILCYETTKKEDDGSVNSIPRHIAKWGKVKEILFGIDPVDYSQVPELTPITQDNRFWPEISTWGTTNVVLLEKTGEFTNPIPLDNGLEARYLVNKSTVMPKIRNACFIEKLYK